MGLPAADRDSFLAIISSHIYIQREDKSEGLKGWVFGLKLFVLVVSLTQHLKRRIRALGVHLDFKLLPTSQSRCLLHLALTLQVLSNIVCFESEWSRQGGPASLQDEHVTAATWPVNMRLLLPCRMNVSLKNKAVQLIILPWEVYSEPKYVLWITLYSYVHVTW